MKRTLILLAVLFGLWTGQAAAAPTALVDRSGQAVDLEAIQRDGKHTVFVFWQTWCGACRKEAPGLAASAQTLTAQAQFIGVISGPDKVVDEERVDRFIKDTGLTYPQVRDRDLRLTRQFNVKGTPTIIVLNTKGEIVYRGHHAPARWSDILGS